MTQRDAYAAALQHLRDAGPLTEDDLRVLCEGDRDLKDRVWARLVTEGDAVEDPDDFVLHRAERPAPTRDEPETDLFVSYAHADDDQYGTVKALVERFQTLQLGFEPRPPAVFYDRRDIRGFDDWEHRILSKLNEAKAMLVVLSPDYFKSAYCEKEWDVFRERERELAHSNGAILNLYAVEIPGFTFDPEQVEGTWMKDLARRQWRADIQGLWHLGPALFEHDDAPAFIEKVRQDLTTLVELGSRVDPEKGHVPRPSKHFVGRTTDLAEMRTRLLDGRVGSLVAAQGLGGMGKSALAFAFAQTYAADYPGGRYLVLAEGRSDLVAAVISLAPTLGVKLSPEESADADAALLKVHAALTESGPALLVVDNVSDPALLAPHQVARALPPTGVHVLATSRLTAADLHLADDACQEVGPLPDDDALRLLGRYRPFAGEPDPAAAEAAARDLVQLLGGYTLALEVAAVYLWNHRRDGATIEDYRDRLRREGFGGLEATGDDRGLALSLHAETHLSTLLAPTLDALTEAEQAVLDVAAVLPPEAVVWPWMRAVLAAERPGLVPEHVPGYPDPWRTIQDRLHGQRLLTPAEQDAGGVDRISRMHRLVREVVRQRMGERVEATDAAAYAVMQARAAHLFDDGWIEATSRWELAPLAEAVTWGGLSDDVRAARLASGVQGPFWKLGQYIEARRLLDVAIRIQRLRFGHDDPNLAALYSSLATVVEDLGDLPEARRLLEDAIRITTLHFDPDHPNLAIRYSNLSGVVQAQGDLPEARRLLEDAIRIQQKHFDADHPNLARSYSNLATVVQAQGDLPAARRLLEDAIRITTLHFDSDHPNVATFSSNLATVVQAQGDLPEARRLLEDAIRIEQKHFHPDHPNLAIRYANLGVVLWDIGERDEAARLMKTAFAIFLHRLGAEHPHVNIAWGYVHEYDPAWVAGVEAGDIDPLEFLPPPSGTPEPPPSDSRPT